MVKYKLASVLVIASTVLAQPSANWSRHISRDRESGDRTTSVSTPSINLVSFFGRKGPGKLEVQTYQGAVGLVVRTFAKTPSDKFPSVTIWLDNEKVEKAGIWSRSEPSSTTLVLLTFEDMLSRLLEAKTFSVEFKGTDDEMHKLTFNVQGLRRHLNFLELKVK